MVLRGIISMWMVWITFATITVVIKKLRGHNWDDLAWKHTWTRRWKTRLLAPWCGHGYTFSSTMCAFMCIFHLWNIHTAGYFNAHDIHLGPNTLFQIVWRLDERAFTVRHHETWPPSLFSPLHWVIVWLRRFKLYLIDILLRGRCSLPWPAGGSSGDMLPGDCGWLPLEERFKSETVYKRIYHHQVDLIFSYTRTNVRVNHLIFPIHRLPTLDQRRVEDRLIRVL